MATIPDRIEEAVDALVAYIKAQEATAQVEWTNEDQDPTELTPIGLWATPAQSYYQIVVAGVATAVAGQTAREFGKGAASRWQTGTITIRSNVFERDGDDLARSVTRQARKIQNWIEGLDEGGKRRNARQWWIDHAAWAPIRGEDGRAPNPGVRVICTLGVNQ